MSPTPLSFLKTITEAILSESSESKSTQEEESFVEKDLDREIKIEDLKTRREFNKLLEQNREERKKYARHIFVITCLWSVLIFLIIIATGIKSINGCKYFDFQIADKVLITLITSTTVNFFGFFFLVVKYLFNTNKKDNKGKIKSSKKTESIKTE